MDMADRLDSMVIFSTEQYGFNREQVGKHLSEIHQKYEKLFNENVRLKQRIKKYKIKDAANITELKDKV